MKVDVTNSVGVRFSEPLTVTLNRSSEANSVISDELYLGSAKKEIDRSSCKVFCSV